MNERSVLTPVRLYRWFDLNVHRLHDLLPHPLPLIVPICLRKWFIRCVYDFFARFSNCFVDRRTFAHKIVGWQIRGQTLCLSVNGILKRHPGMRPDQRHTIVVQDKSHIVPPRQSIRGQPVIGVEAHDAIFKMVASSRAMVLFGTESQAFDICIFHLDDSFNRVINFVCRWRPHTKKLSFKLSREAVISHPVRPHA